MKKRLLSAALALAMVLTLLPVSAFAAPDSAVPTAANTRVTYQNGDDPNTGKLNGKWYWQSGSGQNIVYHEVASGILIGSIWYDENAAAGAPLSPYTAATAAAPGGALRGGNITILSAGGWALDCASHNVTSLTVNTNGKALNLTSIDKLATLNVSGYGTVSSIAKNASMTALNLTASNVTLSGVDLQNSAANRVNLQGNVTISGGLTMDGQGTNAQGATVYANQTLTLTNSNTINGAITIRSGGGTFNLANIQGSASVDLTSTGGALNVSGWSNIGAITVRSTATTATNTAIPSVTVDGCTVASVTHDSGDLSTASASVTVKTSGANVGAISVKAGTVDIQAGAKVGNITVPTGAVKVTGGPSGTTVGDITLNGSGAGTSLTVAGSNVTGGNITAGSASKLTVSIPNDRSNSFGNLSLGSYGGGGILGGVFTTQADDLTKRGWFGNSVKFAVDVGSGYWAYYGRDELSQAIAAIPNDAKTPGKIVLVGHTSGNTLTLQNGNQKAVIGYDGNVDSFKLPAVLLGSAITRWTTEGNNVPYDPNGLFTTDVGTVTLLGQDAPVQLGATKLNGVTVNSNQDYTGGIRAVLVGNVITLTGAVNSLGGYTSIPLTLTTDVRDANGDPVTGNVTVVYNTDTKTVTFGLGSYSALASIGIVLTETTLSMDNGKNVYTLNVSGLGVPAGNLNTAYSVGKDVQVTVTKAGWNDFQKKALIDKMGNSTFEWNTVPAMIQAVNAAQVTINNATTVNNWITQAQNMVWRYGDRTGATGFKGVGTSTKPPHTTATPTDTQRTQVSDLYNTLWLVPYLQVTITDVNEATGYMSLTMTPSYRLVVSGANEGDLNSHYCIVQDGRSLGAITGDFGAGVQVTLDGVSIGDYMHQDGAYVYKDSGSNTWTITHGSSNGLGSAVINTSDGAIEMKPTGSSASPRRMYDSLQAAVDDTQPRAKGSEDEVAVGAGYGGNGVLTMSGLARTIKVTVAGNTTITSSASGDLVSVTGSGHEYYVQLLKDTNVVTSGNITINSATGGSASVNHNPAATGQTVTITLTANAGYTPSGVTVRTASGANVTVSGSGSSYTFVMPAGSVTVTPSFTQTVTPPRKATVSVSPNSMGTTTTTAAATNNQVDSGSSVGVTTAPASGYRTMGVNISTNGGAVTAVRQGDNYFTFTVPANATAVTVTPVYDRDNGTKFNDVWSTEYYSKSVAWAVGRGVTDGTSTYAFSPSNTCTRAQMMTFLWRAAGRPSVAGISNPFVDVSPTLTPGDYYSAILWAVSKGITNGTDATHFSPSRTVSRTQAVTFLYRYEGSPTASTNTGFYDTPSSEYYARAVSWANAKGITNGTSTNYFSPSQGVSRAQAVTFLYRDITGDIA